jgi:hypothetical protein
MTFRLGFIVGAMAACVACAWWAFSAMEPHDDWAPGALSDLERYADRVRE